MKNQELMSGADKEESLRLNDSRLELIEGLPAAIYTCDRQGRITFYNDAAAQLWGRKPEIGQDLWCGSWKIYHADGRPLDLDQCPMAIALKEGRAVKGEEIVIERPDGVRVNVLPHPKPIFDLSGNVTGAINMLVDITEKKEREQILRKGEKKYRLLSATLEKKVEEKTRTLKKSEERYHKMVEEVQDYAILLLDKDGNILNWNKGAEKIKGYSESEIIGKNFRLFYLADDREKKLPELLIKKAIETGRAMHEGWRIRKDGTKFWGSIVITSLHDEHRNLIGFSKVTRDLTERKLAEDQMKLYAEKLAQANEKLKAKNKDLEKMNGELQLFIRISSHDLQEPLRNIQMIASWILGKEYDNLSQRGKEYFKGMQKAANRMQTLIEDLLCYNQAVSEEFKFESSDLNLIVEEVKAELQETIDQKQAVISASELGTVQIIPFQFRQLLHNLISNSLKFSNKEIPPSILIKNKVIKGSELKDSSSLGRPDFFSSRKTYFHISVSDNGIGFQPEYKEKIFEIFQRLNDHTRYEGTGVGLAIVKKIVENHKGMITATSNLNEGAVFNIFIPTHLE